MRRQGGCALLGTYNNELEQFIYCVCYHPIWEATHTYISHHPFALDLTYSRIKYPDNVLLEDMVLEFTRNVRIDEDFLLFDAIVSCTINLTEDNYRGVASCEINQWLVISCTAVITDKLDSLTIADVKPYIPTQQKKTDGQPVSNNIVPIIYKKDLDSEATAFLEKYYPQALIAPTLVPITEIAEKIGLEVLQGHRITDDFSVFGEICFSEGTAVVYDLFKCSSYEVPVRRGTILIDAYTFWERNLGCVNNTIAHEVYHWHRHRIYAAIKHILRNEKVIACRCPSEIRYPSKSEEWTDEQRMEWQANHVAPRILMPTVTFQQKVQELYLQYNYANTPLKTAVLTCIADDLAKFYGVSRQSAQIRMIETGYKEVTSIYQYDSSSKYHFHISQSEAFYEYSTNPEFQKLIDSGLFIYADGYFVINDEKYVTRTEAGCYELSDNAWDNIPACTLQFTWQNVNNERHKHFPFEIFHRANADQRTSKFDSEQSAAAVQMSELLRKKRDEFERQISAFRLTSLNKSCWELMHDIIQQQGLSKSHFCSLTGLDEIVYRRAEKGEQTMPSFSTIMSFAGGLDLDLDTTKKLLQLAGHAFNDTDQHRAYMFCISGFQGRPLEERNAFLESYGYPPLGSKQLK